MAGIIEVKDQGKVRIYDADNSNYVDIVVPSTVSSNRTITIPDASFTIPQETNATHSGEVTGSGALTIADNVVDEANLKVSNSPTNGYMLTAQSGNTGGLTWAAAGGITEADQWRTSADLSCSSLNTETHITANWERNDNTGFNKIGTGISESSGTFTFPSTGIYQITHFFTFYSATGGSEYNRVSLHTTTDNSNYTMQTHNFVATSTAPKRASATSSFLFDVTNTTNCKARFYYYVQGTISLLGTTNKNEFHVNFVRLGDT